MRELSTIVLASVSPRRLELLNSLGMRVIVRPSGVDETASMSIDPRSLAQLHAASKAEVVARGERRVVVGADTVVDVDGTGLGKPSSAGEAAAMLRLLSARRHLVHTAFTVIDAARGRRIDGIRTSQVTFATLSGEQIAAYVASGEPMDKAGAYGIQGRGAALVEAIEGDFYTVMGFPLGDFVRRLPELGYRLPLAGEALAAS